MSQALELAPARYPPGAINVNWFGLFNAVSWQIVLGAPMILYAKSLGASATILGVVAALTPLLVILQIPAAHWLPRYGYRRFILAGWGTRTVFIFGVAAVPLLTFIPPWSRLGLVLLCLFGFNLIRGMASGAWLPWMTELIPHELRGRFLSRDNAFGQAGSLLSLAASAVVLRGSPRPWQFAVVFLISAIGATVSLYFCRRIPDVTAAETMKRSGHRVPWRAMLMWQPFFRLMVFNLLWVAMAGGLGVFTVAYLKARAGYSESRILYVSAVSIIGGLVTLRWVGRFLDREGSRLVLRISLLVMAMILLGWWAVAGRLVSPATATVAVLNLASGIAGTNFNIANSRLLMATMPLMGAITSSRYSR